jgi:hypothetical protein
MPSNSLHKRGALFKTHEKTHKGGVPFKTHEKILHKTKTHKGGVPFKTHEKTHKGGVPFKTHKKNTHKCAPFWGYTGFIKNTLARSWKGVNFFCTRKGNGHYGCYAYYFLFFMAHPSRASTVDMALLMLYLLAMGMEGRSW